MKRTLFGKKFISLMLLCGILVTSAVSCQSSADTPEDTLGDTAVDTLGEDTSADTPEDTTSTTAPEPSETIPDDTSDETDTPDNPDTPDPEPTAVTVTYPSSDLPNPADYTSAARIKTVLSATNTLAITVGGSKHYKNGELLSGGADAVVLTDGVLTVKGDVLCQLAGKESMTATTPEDAAEALGMNVMSYDNKLLLFYEGDLAPLHAYEDIYTLEAMYLYMTEADETELINAFIDLPNRISNGQTNTVFYTAPDLNLGVQTSVYYAQMGDNEGVVTGPCIVAGEGCHADNYTTVRVFNEQQTCISQFLAFPATVKGGVQVAAAQVGEEVLIATCAFAEHDGATGDVRVFDAMGLVRMTVSVKEIMKGPYTIATGHFAADSKDEVLLISTANTNAEGKLTYVLISLSDGAVLGTYTMDCAFALSDGAAPVELSVRRNGEADNLILYFPTVQTVYEGNPEAATFGNAGVTLPDNATSVAPSNVAGEKYIVTLAVEEGDESRSFMAILDDSGQTGDATDVGFRENRFFSARYIDYNDDLYVSKGEFCHIRTDLSNSVLGGLPNCNTNADIDLWFDSVTYGHYTFGDIDQYVTRLETEYLFLEPCFTHRWNAIPHTKKLAEYVDAQTGSQKYVAIGKDGEYMDYIELGSSYYNGTYADGIPELAKLRLYPLRSFLQATAVAFRGENGNPEHLVGVSPVHEHEINVPGSVGDYNPYMIEGFRAYMLGRYGSVENINRIFGTSFASRDDMDAPRDSGRGDWDAYKGDYFTEWSQYNRYIVSKRIMEAYREALLAGYPPESISAHQIPEGQAVGGFLGDANTRLTPIDIVLSCGTAYGGTRYGYVAESPTNFIKMAHLMGHNAISIGEYCALQEDPDSAYKQLYSFWMWGVRMVHQITFNDAQAAAEAEAVIRLQELNEPRPGYAGGTTNAVGIQNGDKAYTIVQLGSGENSDSVGLLKSVNSDGTWEGTVYLVPFHTAMKAEALKALSTPVEGTANRFSTGTVKTLQNNAQLEITFAASYTGKSGAWVTFEVYHNGCRIEDATTTYQLSDTVTPYRYVMSNQLYEEGLEVVVTFHTEAGDGSMEGIALYEFGGTLTTEQAAYQYYDGNRAVRGCKPHEGGVTFDILDREVLGHS